MGQRHRHIRRADKELGAVVVHKRRVATTLFLRQNVDLRRELLHGLDRAGGNHDLTTAHLLTLDTTQQSTHVVTSLTTVELLVEHLDTRQRRLEVTTEANDLDFRALRDRTTLNTTRHDRTTTRNREHILHGHQERLVEVTRRQVKPSVRLLHQLQDRTAANLLVTALERSECRTRHNWRVVTVKSVRRQKLTHFHVHKLQHFLVIHLVDLVHKHDQLLDTDLTSQQQVLTRLRHLTVRSGHHNDRTVHLGSTRDHVTDVIGVSRAVDVRVVAVGRLVLDVRSRDRDTALLLFRRLVNRGIVHKLALT